MAEPETDKDVSVVPWTPKIEQLLEDWHHRVYAAQAAYYEVAEQLRRRNYQLGIPVVIVSSMVGTAVFADVGRDSAYKWVVGSISLIAAVLASLQTFLKLGENATLHGAAADWFAAIRREIEEVLALSPELRGHPKECLDSIRQEMNKAGQKSPELSERLWRRVSRRFGVEEPPSGVRRGSSVLAGAGDPSEREATPRTQRTRSRGGRPPGASSNKDGPDDRGVSF